MCIRDRLDSIDTDSLRGLRDRALIGLMSSVPCTARAAVELRVQDVGFQTDGAWIRLLEGDTGYRQAWCNREVSSWLRAYIRYAKLDSVGVLLFRRIGEQAAWLLVRPMSQQEVFAMVRAYAEVAGVRADLTFSAFRNTGLAGYFRNAEWVMQDARNVNLMRPDRTGPTRHDGRDQRPSDARPLLDVLRR